MITNKNHSLVKEVMGLTFSYRRQRVVTELVVVNETMPTYPALPLVSEVSHRLLMNSTFLSFLCSHQLHCSHSATTDCLLEQQIPIQPFDKLESDLQYLET